MSENLARIVSPPTFQRSEQADLMAHPIQAEVISRTPVPRSQGRVDVRYRIVVPITNIGRATLPAGTVANLMVEDTYSAGRQRPGGFLLTSRRLPSQRMDQTEALVFTALTTTPERPPVFARRFKRVWLQLAPVNTLHSREYHDANDANNTSEISGEELVRKLGL